MTSRAPASDAPAVWSVLGSVAVADLGLTLPHEHLWTRNEGVYAQFPHLYDRAQVLARVVDVLTDARSKGLSALCDATVMGLGRDARFQQEASRASGVHVVAATGVYTFDQLPPYFAGRDAGKMTDCFVHDLMIGIQGTSARAAFLKCATDVPGLTEGVEKVLHAVAAAHRETGAPILTHTSAEHRRGLEQVQVFDRDGVDPSGVVIGHCGDTADLGYLETILRWGCYVGLDRFGQNDRVPPQTRKKVVFELCERGYADRLVLSQDHSIVRDVHYGDAMLRQRTNWRTAFLLESVLTELEHEGGLPHETVQAFVGANVHTWLTSGQASRGAPG